MGDPMPGEVWRSPRPRTEPRTIISVGPNRWTGEITVKYSVPKYNDSWHPEVGLTYWRQWARKSGARPEARDG